MFYSYNGIAQTVSVDNGWNYDFLIGSLKLNYNI
jgi:hypothetical protein